MKSVLFILTLIWLNVIEAKSQSRIQTETPKVSSTCRACHGPKGISPNSQWPNLAGQKRGYLIKQLKAFRSGERKNQLMSPIAMRLSDEQIETLASYYSNLEVSKDDSE